MKRFVICFLVIYLLIVCIAGCGSEPIGENQPVTTTSSSTATTQKTEPPILEEEEVKKFAFLCAGTKEEKVTNYQCSLTYHKERDCQVYEISFDVGRVQYTYVFRATDCDIIVNKKVIRDQ